MKIAVEGCAHGELDKIYEAIEHLEKRDAVKIDLLICCGDFQSTRNVQDLKCMAVPPKYQKMCSFYKYYSGEKVAPVLTIFIGGNHEASNYLQELAYGGWVAPRIYYMGYANIINVAGVRIGGLSGIYKGHDYLKGHFEKPPYSEDTKRSAYHVRNLETFRLKQVQEPVDIFLSHDWPRGVYNYGETGQLLKSKPFFTQEVQENSLGSRPCEELLKHLKPKYWFAAHLHVKFAAVVPHDLENEVKITKFLALDKCLPKRKFLQIVDVPHDKEKSIELEYDLEWLTILHHTNHLLSVKNCNQYMPGPGFNNRWDFRPTKEEMEFVKQKFGGNLTIPDNFARTVTPFDSQSVSPCRKQPKAQINPQTMAFCDRLSVDDPMSLLLNSSQDTSLESSQSQVSSCSTLPSFLTPERQGDVTNVSLDDSSYQEMLDDSMELEMMSKKQDSMLSMKRCASAMLTPRRLSLALPSPTSDVDESVRSTNEEFHVSGGYVQSFRFSPALPSPRDSDMDEPQFNCENGFSDAVSSRTPSTDSEAVSEPSDDLQPKMKKFKRRNHSMYSNSEDDA